ncbi:MAG: queuosine salvage family protein [bacterium]|nr:queuosine salvage family protein [bacterium]
MFIDIKNRYRKEVVVRLGNLWRSIRPEWVTINNSKIAEIAGNIFRRKFIAPNWRIENVLPVDDIFFASWLPYLCAVDFAFTDFDYPHRRFRAEKFYGSMAMGHCFYRHFGERLITAKEMLEITKSLSTTEQFLRGIDGPPPMIDQRRDNLREVADIMIRTFDDDFMNLVEFVKFKAGILIDILCSVFPDSYGKDFVNVDRQLIPDLPEDLVGRAYFNKRANLLALMYQGRAISSSGRIPSLRTSRSLRALADTAVPNALRELGILEYHLVLSQNIKEFTELKRGGRQEIEIRLATMLAVNVLLEKINNHRVAADMTRLSMVELDYFLWNMGRESGLRPHLVRTTAY